MVRIPSQAGNGPLGHTLFPGLVEAITTPAGARVAPPIEHPAVAVPDDDRLGTASRLRSFGREALVRASSLGRSDVASADFAPVPPGRRAVSATIEGEAGHPARRRRSARDTPSRMTAALRRLPGGLDRDPFDPHRKRLSNDSKSTKGHAFKK